MAGFARWLRDAKNVPQTDKSAAVCATPPHLEGAIISRLSKNKLCDEIEPMEPIDPKFDYDIANSVDKVDKEYDDKDGLDDDMYDEEMEVPSEDDLPISKTKVFIYFYKLDISIGTDRARIDKSISNLKAI